MIKYKDDTPATYFVGIQQLGYMLVSINSHIAIGCLKILNNIQDELNLSFEPERKWEKGELQIQMVPQEQVSGWNNIKSLHDKYVAEAKTAYQTNTDDRCR